MWLLRQENEIFSCIQLVKIQFTSTQQQCCIHSNPGFLIAVSVSQYVTYICHNAVFINWSKHQSQYNSEGASEHFRLVSTKSQRNNEPFCSAIYFFLDNVITSIRQLIVWLTHTYLRYYFSVTKQNYFVAIKQTA